MRFLVLLFLAFTIGCEKAPPKTINHGYGFEVDIVDDVTGVSVKYNEEDTFQFPIELVVEAYQTTERCMSLTARGPMVVITNNYNNLFINGIQYAGYFYHSPPLIVIYDNDLKMNFTGHLKHEFVHYLLKANGLPTDHITVPDEVFARCSVIY